MTVLHGETIAFRDGPETTASRKLISCYPTVGEQEHIKGKTGAYGRWLLKLLLPILPLSRINNTVDIMFEITDVEIIYVFRRQRQWFGYLRPNIAEDKTSSLILGAL